MTCIIQEALDIRLSLLKEPLLQRNKAKQVKLNDCGIMTVNVRSKALPYNHRVVARISVLHQC